MTKEYEQRKHDEQFETSVGHLFLKLLKLFVIIGCIFAFVILIFSQFIF